MAAESKIDADDGWFAGEAKTLRYTLVDGDDASDWTLAWELRERRGVTPVVTKATNAGIVGSVGAITVSVAATDTAMLDAGVYHFVLRRTDVGAEQVLSYGPAELLSPVVNA